MYQSTIKKTVSFSGTGIHTGNQVTLTLEPAAENTGILFDYDSTAINVSINNIYKTERSIVIGDKKKNIGTIEHLMSAIYMTGITNLVIKINNNEIPAMDGSAKIFLNELQKAGQVIQDKPLKLFVLKKPIELRKDDKMIIAIPSDRLKITYGIDFNHPDLHNQSIHFDDVQYKEFSNNIAPARTFGFEKEVSSLLKRGLAKGGNLKNAVVLTEHGYLNKKLRFKDECIRHKVLDFIGALALINQPVKAHFFIYKSGHDFDLQFLRKMMK